MQSVRHLFPTAVTVLATAVLLAACAQPDAPPAPASRGSSAIDANAPAKAASSSPRAGSPPDSCGDDHDPAARADSCGADSADACGANASTDDAPALALRRVPSDQVCMRSNRFQGRAQISTEVDGRAYYGCCSGCAKGLSTDAAARTATDPVSGRAVDKASAVIGARPDGSVVYFESDETFARAGGA